MKVSQAKQQLQDNVFSQVEIRKNPADMEQYIALLYTHNGKTFMLAYENDTVLSSPDLEHIVLMLKDIGFRKAKIYF